MDKLIISNIELKRITIKNKDEIIKKLKEDLKKYDKILTKDTLKDGAKDRAKLNNLVKDIEDKRKEIKKAVMIPYEEIEKDFKEITGLISQASTKLDKQIKEFEEEEKIKKQIDIDKLLEANTTGLNFKNEKWLNKGYTLENIKDEISEFVIKFNQDMEILKDEEIVIKDYYKRTLNISQALLEKKRLEELRKKEEQSDKELEEVKQVIQETVELKTTLTLQFDLTRNEAIKLKQFLIDNDIEYKDLGGN